MSTKRSVLYVLSRGVVGEEFRKKQLIGYGFNVLVYSPDPDDYSAEAAGSAIEELLWDEHNTGEECVVVGMAQSRHIIEDISKAYNMIAVIMYEDSNFKPIDGMVTNIDSVESFDIVDSQSVIFVDGDTAELKDGETQKFTSIDFDVVMEAIALAQSTNYKKV